MVVIGLVVVVLVVVVVAVTTTRRGASSVAPVPWRAQLDDWVAAGLVTHEQASEIAAYEAARAGEAGRSAIRIEAPIDERPGLPAPPAADHGARTAAPVIEALGYLGAVLCVTGVVLLVVHYWDDLAVGAQLALTGTTAAALVGAGMVVPERRSAAMRRLRAFLWTLATAAVAVFAEVASREVVGPDATSAVAAWTAGSVALTSGLMWMGRRRPVQHLVAIAALVVAVGTGLVDPGGHVVAGLAVWALGVVAVALGVRRVTTAPVLEVAVGAVAMWVGAMVAVGADPGAGMLFAVLSGAALVAAALHRRLVQDVASIVVLCVVGGLAMVQTLPILVGIMAEDAAVATGAVLWASSAAVGALGVTRVARAPLVLELLGATGMLAGCAVMAVAEPGVATVTGLATALGLLALSLLPGRVALAIVGALGLLVYVPWSIAWFFPGEGRVPLLISVSGLLIIAVAVLMARWGGRFRRELRHP